VKTIKEIIKRAVIGARAKKYPIESRWRDKASGSAVDTYWSEHTVNSEPFVSASASTHYLEWRFSVYPLFREFSRLYQEHNNQTILDYGCGPGNDVIGFSIFSRANKIIGMDVSEKALKLTQKRLAVHRVDARRISLIKVSDSIPEIPLDDGSVDHINCQGVLMSTSHPDVILKEFYRVLKPDGMACIMVYNCDSLWLHLYTAYEKMIIQGVFSGLTVSEAFSKNTDGENCPISICYKWPDFTALCQSVGFTNVEYSGGYLSETELRSLYDYGQKALDDGRLGTEHKDFLKSLSFDSRGLPIYKGKHAGIGGVYHLYK
jgi:SAM-dependent methyltransferase